MQTQSWELSSTSENLVSNENVHFPFRSKFGGGLQKPYETADHLKDNYNNLNFMPQKKESEDLPVIMQMSREFNPVIEFDVNSMEQSGSAVTSSQYDYSYHNRNFSSSTNGNFAHHFIYGNRDVPIQVDE